MRKILLGAFLATLLTLHLGCGGSTIGETGLATYADPVGDVLSNGWLVFNKGSYKSAKSEFDSAIHMNPSPKQLADAYAGMGFALAKENGLVDGLPYFEKAQELNKDARVGLAGYYLDLCDKSSFHKGIELLESLGVQNINRKYVPEYNKDLSDMNVHALLGLLYYYANRYSEAYAQLKYSQQINEPLPQADVKQVTSNFLSKLEGVVGSDGKTYVLD
ncbi:MAG: hypothetical protein PHW04_06720 [Candidatus Wallbacteria bacterium]|nr:hypothetical protein [Candidatus Wallbacteria bacterium]